MRTRLEWRGASDGAIMHVHDPRNVTLQHLSLMGGGMDAATEDILHTGSGGGSRMTYDGVWAWGAHQREPFKRGFHFRGLGENDEVLIRFAQGNMHFTDSARATILVNIKQYAPVVIEGKGEERDGFLGFMSYLATGVPYCLYVRDNQSVVLSDFYHESSRGMFNVTGSNGLPPGRITWTGGRSHLNPASMFEVGMRIDNYRGEVFLGGQDISGPRPVATLRQEGESPVTVFFFGNTFYGVTLDAEGEEGLTVSMLANEPVGDMDYDPKDNVTEEEKRALSRAFDDLRRLGQIDLKMNHHEHTAL